MLASNLPVVTYRYRPALPDALAEWRYALGKATSGRAEVEASAKLVADHLVNWDVVDARGNAVPVDVASIRKVPEPILNQLVNTISVWAPKAETVAGNSQAG